MCPMDEDITQADQNNAYRDAEIYRQLIQHEDEVINKRFTWLGTIEGLLFAGATFIAKDSSDINYLVLGLAVIGILIACSTFYATKTATDTMVKLTKEFKNKYKKYNGPPVIGHEADKWKYNLLRPSRALPLLIIALWIMFSIYALSL